MFRRPRHPYTQALLARVISLETTAPAAVPGSPPDLAGPPPGCPFAPRCPLAMAVCPEVDPAPLRSTAHGGLPPVPGADPAHPARPGAVGAASTSPTAPRRGRPMSTLAGHRSGPLPHPAGDRRAPRRSSGRSTASPSTSAGETLGLVGESGSGKTTLGRAMLRLVEPTGRDGRFEGRDITALAEQELRPLRRRMQPVFQDPHAALNPAMTIGDAVAHPLLIQGLAQNRAAARARAAAMLERVGITPAGAFLDRYPGGPLRRPEAAGRDRPGPGHRPSLVVADEPVAMLDMSVRALVLELMADLRRELGLTYVFITHDLATARLLCDRVAVMYLGRIVEIGPAATVLTDPATPTRRRCSTPCRGCRSSGGRRRARPVLPGRGPRCHRRPRRLPFPPPLPEGLRTLSRDRSGPPPGRRRRNRLPPVGMTGGPRPQDRGGERRFPTGTSY